jgi:glutaredoxin 2
MEELKKDYEFSKEMIIEYGKEYKKETLEEYKTNMIKYYLEKIKRYSNNYASEIEETEKNNKIIKEFEDSLKELDSVSIEDELHTPKEAYNTSFSSHDCCTIGKCPNCNSFVDSYKNKCSCGQVLKW